MLAINRDLVVRCARELRTNESFKHLLAALKQEAVYEFANSASGEAARREEIYRDLQAVGRLEASIERFISQSDMDKRKRK